MANLEDGSFVLPGSLNSWVPGNGGEILDLCQDELRLILIGYPKPATDLPLELSSALDMLKHENSAKEFPTSRVKIPRTTLTNGNQYTGEVNLDGELDGTGEMIFVNGNRYVGEFKANELDGTGIMFYNDGCRFEGQFKYND